MYNVRFGWKADISLNIDRMKTPQAKSVRDLVTGSRLWSELLWRFDVQDEDSPRVLVPPPLLILATLLAGLAVDPGFGGWPATSMAAAVPAAFLGAAGLAIGALALGLFKRFQTRPEPWKPASALVTTGVYRFTRNPMYVGMLLIYAAVALLFRSASAGVLLLPLILIMDQLIIRREEEYLSRRFGAPYEEYRRHVRRWI